MRRTAQEIDRTFICPYDGCTKYFGSEGSQNLHIKIKHNGGSKTDREKLAKTLVKAFAKGELTNEIIDSVDLNLPPGVITKMAQKSGLIDKVNEVVLLETINRRLAPKFREMICGQYAITDPTTNAISIAQDNHNHTESHEISKEISKCGISTDYLTTVPKNELAEVSAFLL